MLDKVSFFAPDLNGGGAERVVSILTSQISSDEQFVDLILAKAEGPYLCNLNNSVNIIDFNLGSVSLCFFKLIKYLRKEKPRVIFTTHMHASIISIWAVKLSRAKTKIIIRQPNMLKPKHYKMSFKDLIVNKLFLISSRFTDKVIVTSKAMADEFTDLSRVDAKKINIIHNPLPIDNIRMKAGEPIVDNILPNIDLPIIIAVGRLEKVKDFPTLIKSFSLVKKKCDAQLIILGEGNCRNELEQLIKQLNLSESVFMPGFVANPYQYMGRADVFVLPSLWEGFPNSMVEAMACSLHVISTNSDGGASEILEDGKWGDIVPIGDVELMSNAILRKINAGKLTKPSPRISDFSTSFIVEKYKRVFNSWSDSHEK